MEKKYSINKAKMKKLLKRVNQCKLLYLLILPPIITTFIFHYIPLYGVQIAFKDFKSSLGIWDSPWVGFKHFITFFNYPYFWRMIRNTLVLNLYSLSTFPLPIVFALMLNEMRSSKLKKICQTITYAPYFVSTVVVCSMVILFTNREGLINVIISSLGGETIDFMSIPACFPAIMVVSGLWSSLGWGTIIYTASLSGVSPELVEAARIDGATRLQVIWHVDIPHIKPTIITMFIMRMGSMLSAGFEKIYLLQNDLNLSASSVISTYTYEIGLLNRQYSYSSAIGLFNSAINVILIMLANTISKKVSETSLW